MQLLTLDLSIKRMAFLAIAQKLRLTHVFIRRTDNKAVLRLWFFYCFCLYPWCWAWIFLYLIVFIFDASFHWLTLLHLLRILFKFLVLFIWLTNIKHSHLSRKFCVWILSSFLWFEMDSAMIYFRSSFLSFITDPFITDHHKNSPVHYRPHS